MTHEPGDLVYKMIMALNAADIDDPICAQAASICAEIADQHCAQIHRTAIVPALRTGEASEPAAMRS
jgi:hypothetical protein